MTCQTDELTVTFLGDGWQSVEQVARELAEFIMPATRSLDIAIYDCALSGEAGDIVAEALQTASRSGVAIRIGYYAGPHQSPAAVPAHCEGSRCFLESLGLPVRPIQGFHALMHDKYVIRDVGTPQAAVWTGSTNWTSDSWSREENLIVRIPSPELAAMYEIDFGQLWEKGKVDHSGRGAGGATTVRYAGHDVPVQVWFSPALGPQMAHAVADAVKTAQRRIVVASPVLTVGSILSAMQDVLQAGRIPITGVYDLTQMRQVRQQWSGEAQAQWKIDVFDRIVQGAGMAGKRSTPYAPGTVHDYMHAKIVVVDDIVFLGSYNFSHSGEENAENLLRFDSPDLAAACVAYIQRLNDRYRST